LRHIQDIGPKAETTEFKGRRILLTGEKVSGEFLIQQARLVDTNVDDVVIKGKGHWLMEEAPREVIPPLVAFINKSQ